MGKAERQRDGDRDSRVSFGSRKEPTAEADT